MLNSRRKLFSKEVVRLAGSNKIDEVQLIERIQKAAGNIERINDLLDANRSREEYKSGEFAAPFKEFRSGIKEILFVLDGLFFEVGGKPHIELNWAKSFADSFDLTCARLLRLLDNAGFVEPIFNEADIGTPEQAKKNVKALRDAISIISSDYNEIQLIRRTNAEEEALWDEYTKDVADPNEEKTLSEQLREMMLFYIDKYGRSGDFEREFMQSGVSNYLKGIINRTHLRVMNGLEEYLKLTGGNREKKLAMKTAISSLLGNPRTYLVLKDNEDFQRWLDMIEIFNDYLPSA